MNEIEEPDWPMWLRGIDLTKVLSNIDPAQLGTVFFIPTSHNQIYTVPAEPTPEEPKPTLKPHVIGDLDQELS